MVKVGRRLDYSPSCLQLEFEISKLSDEIESLEQEAKRLRLAKWKHDIISYDKALSRWLRTRRSQGPCFIRGADTLGAACKLIHDHWAGFWDERERNCPSVADRTAALLHDLPASAEMTWSFPSGELLFERARRSSGAAGVDSWSGAELSALPLVVMQVFAQLSRRWTLAASAPSQFSECRMVLLPKDNKADESLFTNVGDLRPISILSSWWRLWIGTFLRVPECVGWIQNFLPEEVAVGNNVPAEQCVYELLDAWTEHRGGLVSLDYSKAFDSLHPAVSVALLQHVGWPAGLVNVLEHVWMSQKRWVQFQSEVHEDPLGAPALPQGDPLGPLVMSLWVVSGHRYVQRLADPALGRVLARYYVDDRTLVSASPEALRQHVDLWLEWSGLVGLVENRSKMVVIGKQRYIEDRLVALFPGVVSSVGTVLGIGIGFRPRKTSLKESERISAAIRTVRLLACARLPFVRFLAAVRIFASSKILYGWISKFINLRDSKRFWSAVGVSSRRLRSASPWLRAVVFGGNMHPDCICATRLVGLLARLRLQGPLSWSTAHGHPVATFHAWLIERGWRLIRPFVWKCDASHDLLDLEQPA